MNRKLLFIAVILALISSSFSCGPIKPSISGTYVCTEGSEGRFGTFSTNDYFEFKKDGTLYVRVGGSGSIGEWELRGNEIVITIVIMGTPVAWKGEIQGNTIILDDGSTWVKEREKPAMPTTRVPTTQKASTDDIEWLARVIASEAGSVWDSEHWVRCTDEERAAVGWTVLNRLSSSAFGKTVKEVVTAPAQYATNQKPTSEIRAFARKLLEKQIRDATEGATHFFSPVSMPKEGESTTGFDVGGGLHEVPGIAKKVYFPSWTKTYTWVGDLKNVRRAYFMFYRFSNATTRTAMGPSDVVKAFYEAFSKERYSEVVSYYGPKLQTEVLATREGYKKMYPEKSDADIWISAITFTVGEAFYLEWKEDGWVSLLDMERIEIKNEKISEDGKAAVVEFTIYCKRGVEYSEPKYLINVGNVWQIGE